MKKHINILFLGGAKRVSLAERFIQAGKELGFDIRIFSYELDNDVPISVIGRVIIGKKWNDPEVLQHLSDVCYENTIHIVVPFLDPATIIASKLKDGRTDLFIPVSDEALCMIFFDKINSNEWFRQHHLPIPSNDMILPLIAKPRKGSASKGIKVLNEQAELDAFLLSDKKEKYLLQEYIVGDEFSVDCYVSTAKEILAVVPRKRLEVANGEVTKTITIKEDNIIKLSEEMLAKSGLVGPLTIQFIRDRKSGKDYFMEVNPRFGGGAIAAIEAGADIPEMILKDYLGVPNKQVTDWKENLLMMRAHREFFRYANYN